jgi:hypothetical protein
MNDLRGAVDRARARAEADRPAREPRHTLEAFVVPYLRHRRGGTRLRAAPGRHPERARARRLAIVVVPAALPLTAAFLDHHRALGVEHFLCLALGDAPVPAAADISAVRIGHPSAVRLLATLNAAAQRWGSGRWVLFLLPHEFLVYPYMETRGLADLVQHLEDDRRTTLHAVTLDLYGASSSGGELVERRRLETCFDGWGYVQFPGRRRSVEIRGGPGLRAFHAAAPEAAPMLQRIVLVAWRPWYHFVRFRQLAVPLALNRAHRPGEVSISGVLLRYGAWPARTATPTVPLADRLGFEDERVASAAAAAGAPQWYDPALAHAYEGSASLVEAGLMSAGRWF